jgi:hypothetical protein
MQYSSYSAELAPALVRALRRAGSPQGVLSTRGESSIEHSTGHLLVTTSVQVLTRPLPELREHGARGSEQETDPQESE